MDRPPYAHHGGIGGNDWPERLRAEPVPLPELPDHPTQSELARAYASVTITWAHHWPIVVEALHWLYGAIMARGARDDAIDRRLAYIESRLGPVPIVGPAPIRAELASSHELANEVARDIAQQFDAEAKNPSTPPPDANDVERMVAERVAHELLKIKAAELEKREAQREWAEKLAADRSKAMRRFWISLAVTGASIATALIEHFLR